MPIVSDLDAAMMQPARSVPAVRRLGGGTIRMNDAGRPLRAVGHDAVVYELRTPIGRILALRCLLRQDSRRDSLLAHRYHALRADPRLERLRAGGGPLPRDILWVADGIVLPAPDLRQVMAPMVVMERVPGRTLMQTVDRLCRERQSEPLALLADGWLTTVTSLEDASFVHGDLAADNLMVRPDGSIALVDLDTASWPSLGVDTALSEGTPAYVHPRGAPVDPARRDRFPALVIWASLRVLARHPDLRERWGDRPDQYGGALLWSADDLRRPARAPLFAALDAIQAEDEMLVPLLDVVRRAIHFPPDETPPLTEVAERLEGLGFPRLATPGSGRGRPVRTPLEMPLPGREPVPDFDDMGSEWRQGASARDGRGERGEHDPDASHTTTLTERERRRATARELGAAIAARDTATAVGLWETSRTVPETATYAAAVHLLVSREATAAIERALRRKDDDGLVAAVTEAERAGIAPSAEARVAVRAARQRIAARMVMRDAVGRRDFHALASLACSGTLDCLGRLEATHARAVERALAWATIERALVSDDDVAIAAAVDPALWREEGSLPPAARTRLDLARSRIRWAEDVRAALRRRDGVGLRGLLTSAPPGAETYLTEVESRRILRISTREAAVSRLERALREGPDREVAIALAEFETAGAPFPDVLDWAAVRGVVDRISLADAIRSAAAADPPDTAQLARLLPAARAALGDQGAPGEPDWVALERSVLRTAHVARLREAIALDDDARIWSAAIPDPYGARALLTPDENDRVDQALARRPHRAR
ncbi:MAG: hypothetical protein KY456_07345 [Chloroflexi bacterium]|nr:hypothetical protein [Chloroflexota bacterium]